MELSDFFVGKPGAGSVREALAKRLPLIVQRKAWSMAQERYNTEWVEELGAIVIENFSPEIALAVPTLLEPEHYARCRERAATARDMAVYEVPEMPGGILAETNGRPLLTRTAGPGTAARREEYKYRPIPRRLGMRPLRVSRPETRSSRYP
jgi:hypothetical protein